MDRMRLFRIWLYCQSAYSRGSDTLAFIQTEHTGSDEFDQQLALDRFERIYGWSLASLSIASPPVADGEPFAGIEAIPLHLYHPWSPPSRNTRLFEFIEHRGHPLAYIEVPSTLDDVQDKNQAIQQFQRIFRWDPTASYCERCRDSLITDIRPIAWDRYYQWC